MLDRHLRPFIDPPLNLIGGQIARSGLTANMVTFIGLAFGLAGAGAIIGGHFFARGGADPRLALGRWSGWRGCARAGRDRFWRLSGYHLRFHILRRDSLGLRSA